MSFTWRDGWSGRISVAGARLEYACVGPEPSKAPTLILLHEGLGSVALWRDIPTRLCKLTGCGVFVYSRQGYGRSVPAPVPRPLDYMAQEAVDVLPKLLDQISVRQAILVGHSDGASIAAIHGGRVNDPRVRGMVLIAPHFFVETLSIKAIEATKTVFEKGDLNRKLKKYHNDPAHTFNGWCDAWLHPDFADWNIADVLDNIRTPILAIQGTADPFGTLAQISVIPERCPATVETLILPKHGHAPHLEAADLVLPRIAEFVHNTA